MLYEWLKEHGHIETAEEASEAAFNSIRKYFPEGIENVSHGQWQSRIEYAGGWIDLVFFSTKNNIVFTNILIVNTDTDVSFMDRFDFPIQYCAETNQKFRSYINF